MGQHLGYFLLQILVTLDPMHSMTLGGSHTIVIKFKTIHYFTKKLLTKFSFQINMGGGGGVIKTRLCASSVAVVVVVVSDVEFTYLSLLMVR